MSKDSTANECEERKPLRERAEGGVADERKAVTLRGELEKKRAAGRQEEEEAYAREPTIPRRPIEEEDLGDEPLDTAHTDEPGEGGRRALSAEQKRELEEKRAVDREREEEAYRREPSVSRSSFQREDGGKQGNQR